jgi:gamma-glutamylcyclotransferase (GGCT)/AIG2-like uncharacterized protein YtfP
MNPADEHAVAGDRSRVFVYGTLRRGGSNHFRMAGAVFSGPAVVPGRLYQIDWYPGLVIDPAGDPVQGEVYEVGAAQLAALDEFEGVSAAEVEGSEYRRVQTLATLPDGSTTTVWVWEWIGPVDETRRMSDWLA